MQITAIAAHSLTFGLVLRDTNEPVLVKAHLWRKEVAVKLVGVKLHTLVVLIDVFLQERRKNHNGQKREGERGREREREREKEGRDY